MVLYMHKLTQTNEEIGGKHGKDKSYNNQRRRAE